VPERAGEQAALPVAGAPAASPVPDEPVETPGTPIGNIFYGTSSWTDKTLLASKRFYPPGVDTPEERLRFYAERFPLVEVDSTYYALPAERNAALWAERTPPHFVFDVKAFGLLTGHPVALRSLPPRVREQLGTEAHEKTRLYPRDLPEQALNEVWEAFASALAPLDRAGKLGAVLFQFPPWFTNNKRNREWLRELPQRFPLRVAVEFRGGGWMDEGRRDKTIAMLEELGLAYVVVDEPQRFKSSTPPVVACTSSDLAMLRFHGHNAETWEKPGLTAAERFRYLYSDEELREWVPAARELAGEAKQLHVLMNNCYEDYGVRNASQLAGLLR
jgi:uncharacterized protein YecE (DUF72 family)